MILSNTLEKPPAMLSSLPTELLLGIGEEIDVHSANSRKTLAALARVNARFHAIFAHLLYDSLAKAHDSVLIIGSARCGNLAALQLAHEKYGVDVDRIRVYPITNKEKSQLGIKYNLSPGARWGTPLHFAAAAGQMKVVSWLLSKNVDIEAPGRLYCGCETVDENMPGYYRTFEWEPGHPKYHDPKDRKVMVWTPLHYAVCQGRTNVAHRLLNAGASPACIVQQHFRSSRFVGLKDVEKFYDAAPPRHRPDPFAEGSHLTWFKWDSRRYRALRDANSDLVKITALHTAALRGNKTISRRLVKMGVDINSRSPLGERPLSYAILSKNRSMVRLFLSMGADASARAVDSIYGRPEAVAVAFSLGRPEAAMTLLRNGSPTWGTHSMWGRYGFPQCFLAHVLLQWQERSTPILSPTSPEDVLPKRRAFLMLTRETLKSIPWEVSGETLKAALLDAFYCLCTDGDFDLKSLIEYLKITGLTLETPVESGLVLGTVALYYTAAVFDDLSTFHERNLPIMNYLLQKGVSPFIDIDWQSRRDPLDRFLRNIAARARRNNRGEVPKEVVENVDVVIEVVNLFASHGAFGRAVQKDRDGVLQAYGTLIGHSEEHALDSSTRRRLKAGTIACIPRRLLKSLRGFETCLY